MWVTGAINEPVGPIHEVACWVRDFGEFSELKGSSSISFDLLCSKRQQIGVAHSVCSSILLSICVSFSFSPPSVVPEENLCEGVLLSFALE